jgi:hypothetical protein
LPNRRIGWLLACLAGWGLASAQHAGPTLDQLAALKVKARENALAAIRGNRDGEATLLALETEAALRAEARRQAGQPPLFRGCLRADEFELSAQLALARAAANAKAYRLLAGEYRRLTTAVRTALAAAQSSGKWRARFAHLGHWIDDWESASQPAARELLQRTLVDQAIRASLSSFDGPRIYGKSRPTAALRAYDEYIFNLMCTADEDNINWLKAQVAHDGWFDISRYGRVADQAAVLMVQHADGDSSYQAYVASLLESKVARGDTDPRNFAFLSDRIAVRAGRPQRFATQMECVDGEWIAPQIEELAGLDTRRAAMGLPSYREQIEQRRNLSCRRTKR